jgi:hypothetical protein
VLNDSSTLQTIRNTIGTIRKVSTFLRALVRRTNGGEGSILRSLK